jgi:hypothetical protein
MKALYRIYQTLKVFAEHFLRSVPGGGEVKRRERRSLGSFFLKDELSGHVGSWVDSLAVNGGNYKG